MKESYIVLLLQLISMNASTQYLIRLGLTYSQISRLISEAFDEEYILSANNEILLTEKGRDKIRLSPKNSNLRGSNRWITPKIEDKIDVLSLDVVYLPEKKGSFFNKLTKE